MKAPVKGRGPGQGHFRWPPRLARLLGQVTDGELARRAGIHLQTVRAERRRRGIPAMRQRRPNVRWTRAMVSLLGTATDQEVAAELGLPVHCVLTKRRRLRIPAYLPPHERRRTFWTPRRVALLGTASDAEIARRLGLSTTAVHDRRRLLGIASFAPWRRRPRWTRGMLRLLGRASDREVAQRLGLHATTVRDERLRRGIPAHEPHLAVARTAKLAAVLRRPTPEVRRLLGVGTNTVYQMRKDLGVPTPPRPSAWTPRARALLGKVPDAALARQLGLSKAWVARMRQLQGQLRFRPWTPEEECLLGTGSDRQVAERLGRSVKAVGFRRRLVARRAETRGVSPRTE